MDVEAILYRAPPRWGLPSLSFACIQVEAYLRIASVPFSVLDCATASSSPTGQVPAIDTSNELMGLPAAAEGRGAGALVDHLRNRCTDLDRGLTGVQQAQLLAFTALLESRIVPAVLYTTWCEDEAYACHTRGAYGDQLAFPLSYLLPRSQRKQMLKRFAGTSAGQLYSQASAALGALASHLAVAASGPYFLGAQPTSLDALLYGVLAYLKAAPVVHPELREKIAGSPALTAYVDRISSRHFATTVPSAADSDINWSQHQAANGGGSSQQGKPSKEGELQRKGLLWLAGAAVVITGYVLFQGQYFQMVIVDDGSDDDADGEDGS